MNADLGPIRRLGCSSIVFVAFALSPFLPPVPARERPRPISRRPSRRRAGCSSSAACSTRAENRCRAQRSWFMRGTWHLGRLPTCPRGTRFRSEKPAPTARDGSGSMRPGPHRRRHDRFGAVALAPGHGAGWVELDPDDEQPTADISLRPEQVIHGRLFDVQGQPAPGVTLSVSSITSCLSPGYRARVVAAPMVSIPGGRRSRTFRPGPGR